MSERDSDFKQQYFAMSLPCAAEKSISGCGWERAEIQRSLSLLKGKEKKQRWFYLPQLRDVTTNKDILPTMSQPLTVCQSVAAGLCLTCAAGTGSSGGSEV